MERKALERELAELGFRGPYDDYEWLWWPPRNRYRRKVMATIAFKRRFPKRWDGWVKEFKREKFEADLKRVGREDFQECPLVGCPSGGAPKKRIVIPYDFPGLVLVPGEQMCWSRAKCTACGRTFSLQRYSPLYRMDEPDYNIGQILERLGRGASYRRAAGWGSDKNLVLRLVSRVRKNPRSAHRYWFPNIKDQECWTWSNNLRTVEKNGTKFLESPGEVPFVQTSDAYHAARNRAISSFIREEDHIVRLFRLASRRVLEQTEADKKEFRRLKTKPGAARDLLVRQSWWIPPEWMAAIDSLLRRIEHPTSVGHLESG